MRTETFSIDKWIIFLLFLYVLYLYTFFNKNKNAFFIDTTEKQSLISNVKIHFDTFEVYKYNEIKKSLIESKCSQMWGNQKEFLNGIIRKFKPEKILELGVFSGGSSIVILNAIDDFNNSKLYSIELNSENFVGQCVNKFFPKFLRNWKLYKGNIATEYIEKIGNNIDIAMIDTAHFEPGEILDFLMILPFLKEEAIVIFHDIGNQITSSKTRNEWAPYIIFNAIRGEKYLPSGKYILKQDIGAIKLEKNQKKYYHDYFRLLGGQWQYFPKKKHIRQIAKFFKKYYDEECLIMFEEAITFNRNFVKNNPMKIIYNVNSD